MRLVPVRFLAVALTLMVFPLSAAHHDTDCLPTKADPATVNAVTLPDGTTVYVEERGVPVDLPAPVPGTGFLVGDGTWIYQESNGVGGLQRGGMPVWERAINDALEDLGIICYCGTVDPITDETCGHGPDTLLF